MAGIPGRRGRAPPLDFDHIETVKWMKNEMNGRKRKREQEKGAEPLEKKAEPINKTKKTGIPHKKFILRHTFEKMSDMENESVMVSPKSEHSGVPWCIKIERVENHLAMYLRCERAENPDVPWSIETDFQLKILHSTGIPYSVMEMYTFEKSIGSGTNNMLDWGYLMRNGYFSNDSVTVEIHVTIRKMAGIHREILRNFDNSNNSDMALIVGDRKFHVSKLYLASQSAYFEAMFSGRFQDSTMAEITLNGIESDDFQKYLEILYVESAADELTVDGILSIADMYDTPCVTKKCEKFLVKESKKPLKLKLEIAVRYGLEELKTTVIRIAQQKRSLGKYEASDKPLFDLVDQVMNS